MSNSCSSYRLTPRAETDLEDIWLYSFEQWSPEQADHYLAGLVDVFEGLADGRLKGRPIEGQDGYLKYPVGSHLVFYKVAATSMIVIRVLHARMDPERHL